MISRLLRLPCKRASAALWMFFVAKISEEEVVDSDGDTIPNATDNCPTTANSNQADFDNDSLGDVCDPDDDNDGLLDTVET